MLWDVGGVDGRAIVGFQWVQWVAVGLLRVATGLMLGCGGLVWVAVGCCGLLWVVVGCCGFRWVVVWLLWGCCGVNVGRMWLP